MYAAIYGYAKEGEFRQHLGNVRNIEYTINERTYDFSTTSIKGYCDFELVDDLVYVINTEGGKQISAGFIKNVKKLEGNLISFSGDDFKRILDTDVLIDFTSESSPSFTLGSIFTRVVNAVQAANRDPFISKMNLNFITPDDETDTRVIADYTGQYIVTKALKFLKAYLSFYGYYIKPSYSVIYDEITFRFIKSNPSNTVDIKLKDFIHEKTSQDIKVNKAVATIKFTPKALEPDERPIEWEESTASYFNSQPESNRATIQGTGDLPQPSLFTPGFALRVISQDAWYKWESASQADYNAATNRITRNITKTHGTCGIVSFEEATKNAGSPSNYALDTVIAYRYVIQNMEEGILELCPLITYIKINYGAAVESYYRLGEFTYTPRPNLPERIYLLGKDNQIYDGYGSIPENQRIYPIVTKIFEAQYLSEAQINAVYELVNNRYVENIIITLETLEQPMDLASLDLYTMIRAYDDNGNYKDLPISEKTTIHNAKETRTEIKLGFKKTLLTEVIKNDIGEGNVIKSTGVSGGGTTTVIKPAAPWTGSDAPDPYDHDTWFKPLAAEELQIQSFIPSIENETIEQEPEELVVASEEDL